MKKIFIMLLSSVLSVAAIAQTLTITFNGSNNNSRNSRNYQVVLDGTSYYSNSTTGTSPGNSTITLANQQVGSHTLAVYRLRNNNATNTNGTTASPYGNAIYTNTFQLRQGYDMDITINPNGQVTFSEKRIRNQGRRGYNQQNLPPMADANFNQLVQSISRQWSQSSRITQERNTFANTTNYFTTAQVRQLLLLISTEANRLALAKLAYPRVVDPSNFTVLYDVFPSTAARDDMNAFIRNNPNYNGSNNNNTGNNSGNWNNNNNTARTPMADYQFSQLLQTVNSQWDQSGKINTITGAFSNTANYFSTSQIRQLLTIVTNESDRLALAKSSYTRVSDAANFSSLYDLFYNQANRNELNNYVIQNGVTNTGYNNNTQYNNQYNTRVAMSDANFSQLLQKASNHILPWDKVRDVRDAFSNTSYYFSTYQIRQLLSLATSENERLELAKLAWSRVSDPSSFTQLYDMFTSQASRDALNTYVMQNGGTNTGYNSNTGYNNQYSTRVAMSDANFSQVLQKASNHFLPWDKVRDVRDAFNNTSYYFSTTQIRQLLSLATTDNDRLELAKLAWSRVSDPSSFTQLYDLLSTQASRDDLNNYITTHPLQ